MNIHAQHLKLHFVSWGLSLRRVEACVGVLFSKCTTRLLEFGKQQPVFVTAHLLLGRSLLFPQSALDLFGCRLGAAAGGVEDARPPRRDEEPG